MTAGKLEEFPGWKAPRILKLNVKCEAISPEDFVKHYDMLLQVTSGYHSSQLWD